MTPIRIRPGKGTNGRQDRRRVIVGRKNVQQSSSVGLAGRQVARIAFPTHRIRRTHSDHQTAFLCDLRRLEGDGLAEALGEGAADGEGRHAIGVHGGRRLSGADDHVDEVKDRVDRPADGDNQAQAVERQMRGVIPASGVNPPGLSHVDLAQDVEPADKPDEESERWAHVAGSAQELTDHHHK